VTVNRKARRLRAAAVNRRLFQRRFRRLCEVPTCPCYATHNSLLCAGHGQPAPPALLPETYEAPQAALPFEVTP
jgi:hypothetical protein